MTPLTPADRSLSRFAAANLFGLAVAGGLLVWLSRNGAVDFRVAGAFFDPASGGFYLKDAPLLARVGHTGLKWLALLTWLSAVALTVASCKVEALRRWRGPLAFFSVAVAVATVTVASLKLASGHSCPWDLEAFGGSASWFPLFDPPGAAPGPGRCWPSGHAGGGYSLLAGYFAFRDRHRPLARAALVSALGLGALMSLVQTARGAHFLTHNLWSLWIAWLCCFVSYFLWRRFANDG